MGEVSETLLEANNTGVLIGLLLGNLAFITLLVIAFKVTLNKHTEKFFLPILMTLLVLLIPLFTSSNLWMIEWIPQLALPYDIGFSDGLTMFEKFSLFYFNWVPLVTNILYLLCVLIFIQYLKRTQFFGISESVLLFVPFANHYLTGKFLFANFKGLGDRIFISLFLFVSITHWFYKLIAPLLLLIGFDLFGWYFDFLSGESEPVEEPGGYTFISDYLYHFNATLMSISTILTVPIYFITKGLGVENKVEYK